MTIGNINMGSAILSIEPMDNGKVEIRTLRGGVFMLTKEDIDRGLSINESELERQQAYKYATGVVLPAYRCNRTTFGNE